MKASRNTFSSVLRLLLPVLVAFLGLGLFTTSLAAQKVDSLPKPTDYVSDLANVLSPEAIAHIDSVCAQLDHSAANSQIAVVTIHSLDGADPAEYANELEDKWKIGPKGTDRGVLVLLAVDDHKYRIDVGYGLEGILNDAKVGDMRRAMVPSLKSKDYDTAITGAVDSVAQVIAADAKVTLNEQPDTEAMPVRHVHHGSILPKLILIVIILLFFGGGSLLRMLFGYGLLSSLLGGGGYRGGGGGNWGGGSSGGGGGFGGFGGGGFGGGGAGGSW